LYKRLIIRTKLYLISRMRGSSKAPEGLKGANCEKGKLGVRPPIPYVPLTDQLRTKENMDTLKVKLSDGTVFTMSIFAKGNPEDYLLHVQVVQGHIGQKGLEECKTLSKGLKDAHVALEVLKQKSIGIGPWDKSSKEAQDDIKD
jgi:hypothetical protein